MKKLIEIVENPSGLDSLANYMGETDFGNLMCVLCTSRDADLLTQSNFTTALEMLGGESDNVQVHRFGHWACGWWEALAVKEDSPEYQIALDIEAKLEDYPVLDEEDWSNREQEEAMEIWRDCYDKKDRLNYIRSHRSQFDFNSMADVFANVSGESFAGYASELVN